MSVLPGPLQPLLNQTLIPLTMVFSFLFLSHFNGSRWEVGGAVVIMVRPTARALVALQCLACVRG